VVDPFPDVSDEVLCLPVLGILMGTLLHQRGLFTLHASAVSVHGDAVAFIGQKGAGKSTMAAAMQVRGHGLITDDVLALDMGHHGDVLARSAFPQIKLWPESATALGYSLHALPKLSDTIDKRVLRSTESFCEESLSLKHIFLLSEGTDISLNRLQGGAAFTTLLAESYAPRFLGSKASTPTLFRHCKRIADHVPIHRLDRPRDLDALDRIAAFVEEVCRLDKHDLSRASAV
jgi:hypothetical protein